MSNPPDAKIEIVHGFLEQLDHRLGALNEEEVQALFLDFSESSQPWVMDLLAAIEEAHQVDPGFLGEAAFYVYALQQFYEEVLRLPPSPVERRELLDAVDRVDAVIGKQAAPPAIEDIGRLDFPCLRIEVPGLFFTAWQACLDDLVEEGFLDADMRWDLARYYLVVLTVFGDQFPAAHM
jgi:hypothetical protein